MPQHYEDPRLARARRRSRARETESPAWVREQIETRRAHPRVTAFQDEQGFQKWYGDQSSNLGLNPDPDSQPYDYRAAYGAGAGADAEGHWPSEFKRDDHPNLIVDGVNTKTGAPAGEPDVDPRLARARSRGQAAQDRLREELAGAKTPFGLSADASEINLERRVRPFTAGAMNQLTLGHAPGTELRGRVDPETLEEQDPTGWEKLQYWTGNVAGALPAFAVTGGLTQIGLRAAAGSQALGRAAPALAKGAAYLRRGAGGPAKSFVRAGVQNVAEGLSYSIPLEPFRALPEGVSRAESVARNTGVGMAADALFGIAGRAVRGAGRSMARGAGEIPLGRRIEGPDVPAERRGYAYAEDLDAIPEADFYEVIPEPGTISRAPHQKQLPARTGGPEIGRGEIADPRVIEATPLREGSAVETLRGRGTLPRGPLAEPTPRVMRAREIGIQKGLIPEPAVRARPTTATPAEQQPGPGSIGPEIRDPELVRPAPIAVSTTILEEYGSAINSLPKRVREPLVEALRAGTQSELGMAALGLREVNMSGEQRELVQDMLVQARDRLPAPEPRRTPPRPDPTSRGAEGTRVPEPVERRATTDVERAARRERISDEITPSKSRDLQEAYTDELTSLPNQQAFQKAKARIDADPSTEVVMIDLRNFKAVNDFHGHEAGDAKLTEVGATIRSIAEDAGLPARDVFFADVFRAGGDEFVLSVPVGRGDELGRAIQEAIGEEQVGASEYYFGARYGVGSTFKAADEAALAAKAAEGGPDIRGEEAAPAGAVDLQVTPKRPSLEGQEPEILHRVSGDEGIEARVVQTDDGRYSVTLRDAEAGETLPSARIFDDLDAAKAHADEIGGRPPTEEPAAPQAVERAAETAEAGAPIRGAQGNEADVAFPSGQRLQTRWRVVEAGELTPSHSPDTWLPNEAYPAEVQGRQYHLNKTDQERFEGRLAEFDEARALDPTAEVGAGVPTIREDGIVIAGNERTMMLQRLAAQEPEKYAAYRAAMETRAEEVGISAAEVAGMKQPVLVREIADPSLDLTDRAVLRDLNQQSDVPVAKGKDLVSDAAARGRKLEDNPEALEHLTRTIEDEQTLNAYLGTAAGREFVDLLESSGVIESGELATFRDPKTRAVNEEGAKMIERTLQAAAIGDVEVVSLARQNVKGVLAQMEHAFPAIIRAASFEGFDMRGTLQEMLALQTELTGTPFKSTYDMVVQQTSLLPRGDSPDAVTLSEFIDGANKLETKTAFHRYAKEAAIAAEAETQTGFAFFEPKTSAQAFDDAFGAPARMNRSKQKPCQ